MFGHHGADDSFLVHRFVIFSSQIFQPFLVPSQLAVTNEWIVLGETGKNESFVRVGGFEKGDFKLCYYLPIMSTTLNVSTMGSIISSGI